MMFIICLSTYFYNYLDVVDHADIDEIILLEVLCLMSAIVNGLVVIFVGYLLAYHIWLWKKGMTTYQHILENRRKENDKQHKDALAFEEKR